MIDGILALTVVIGLCFAIVGGFKLMRSVPILGGDVDGYLALHGGGQVDELVAQQRAGWRLLLVGFVLQCASALVAAVLAFSGG